jgi:hypothetical protein
MYAVMGGDKPSSRIVTLRCRSCAQQLGRSSPALAVVDFSLGEPHGEHVIWRIRRITAWQRDRQRFGDPPRPGGGDPLADRAQWESVATVVTDAQGQRSIRQPKGVELACPRCPHRPRKRQRDLFELAERALAEGQAEVYL